jgi:5-methylcytosine-specific restriction protein A
VDRDFVVYHNTDKMGKLDTSSYGIVTGHDTEKARSQRVWLISGDGRPRRYCLEQTFIVDKTGRSRRGSDYSFYATGESGFTFEPPVELNDEPWFEALRTATGNLAFGLQPINDPLVRAGLSKTLQRSERPSGMFPGELPKGPKYIEGSVSKVLVNRYERDLGARRACLESHGPSCKVCGIVFVDRYGEIGKDFIEVHHLRSISSIGKEYCVDPIQDLVPVCPNCHSMLHTKVPPLSIKELKAKLH